MLIEYTQEKLIGSILYFTQNTNHCVKLKLNLLLFLLDFKHYGQIGRKVTGLDYYAGPDGPIPSRNNKSIDADIISVTSSESTDKSNIKPSKKFDGGVFTKREKQIMNNLVDLYKDSDANDIIKSTYLNRLKWNKILKTLEKRQQQKVSFDLAQKEEEKEMISKIILENNMYWQKYR